MKGDAVTLKTSKRTNADLTAVMITAAADAGWQPREIGLGINAGVFVGTDLTVSVVKKLGAGLVKIGFVDGSDADGSAVIPGDSGRLMRAIRTATCPPSRATKSAASAASP